MSLDLRIPDYPFTFSYQFTDLLAPSKLGKRVVQALAEYRASLPAKYYDQLSAKYSTYHGAISFIDDMEQNKPMERVFLESCKPSSVGHAYLQYLSEHDLAPLQLQDQPPQDATIAHKIRFYRPMLHDLEHMIFDVDTSQRGELILIAINHGAYQNEESEFAIKNIKIIPSWIRKIINLPTNKEIDSYIEYGSMMLPVFYGEYSKLMHMNYADFNAEFLTNAPK